jgi:hypothetical protein
VSRKGWLIEFLGGLPFLSLLSRYALIALLRTLVMFPLDLSWPSEVPTMNWKPPSLLAVGVAAGAADVRGLIVSRDQGAEGRWCQWVL